MKGFFFPLTINNERLVETSKINNAYDSGIKGRIKAIVETSKGTRAFAGDYGIGLEAVFSLVNGNSSAFKKHLVQSINTYIPEVTLTESDINVESNEGKVTVSIKYDERDIALQVYFQVI